MPAAWDDNSKRKAAKKKRIRIILCVVAILVIVILLILAFVMQFQFQAGVRRETDALKAEVQEMEKTEEMRNSEVSEHKKAVNQTIEQLKWNEAAEIDKRTSRFSERLEVLLTLAYKLFGWHKQSGDVFYNVHKDKMKFSRTITKCADDDATPASNIFKNPISDDIITTQLQTVDALWIGYSKNETWNWIDGDTNATRWLKWDEGEPSEQADYIYAAVTLNKTANELKMKSYNSDTKLGYVCERSHGFSSENS